ncbi:type I glutamate--ammonia ligase [Metallumcola ferriviriculae]|uniref:Glutamine synthetase n=1 Tax=Metallumcola ferriviriculae TaxID=3039180 RepID=A0AAU0UTG8_9FIRM|nr:type I glutamate--ammonia ligase [Desulfitibacteraceae bacterium MK1]
MLSRVAEENVEFIRLQFTDIFGIVKNLAITVEELEKALNGELMFDGSSIDGFARVEESDMYLRPDPSTFAIFPWSRAEDKTARLICDVYKTIDEPFEGCPRGILKKVLKEANEMGYTVNVGPEGEFFLFHTDERNRPVFDIHDEAGYFDLSPTDKGEKARRDMVLALKKLGFRIEASHHEVAPSQHEIDFQYDEALKTADRFVTFKYVVRNIAHEHGLYATFMPKPLAGENGSAMHCHQSLYQNGDNAFYDPQSDFELSTIAKQYIAGILKHANAIAAIGNPTVNSYKRLEPGYEAPVNVAWSTHNRSALVRVPPTRGNGTRLELRNPDATANPYLLFAVMIKAGLDGIKNNLEVPEPINGNVYELTEKEREEAQLTTLPRNLEEALEDLQQDDLICQALGEHTLSRFLNIKYKEWQEYRSEVHPWEIRRYFKKF